MRWGTRHYDMQDPHENGLFFYGVDVRVFTFAFGTSIVCGALCASSVCLRCTFNEVSRYSHSGGKRADDCVGMSQQAGKWKSHRMKVDIVTEERETGALAYLLARISY